MNGRRERKQGLTRLLLLLGLGAFGLLPLAASGVRAEPAGTDGLEQAVVEEMLGRSAGSAGEFSAASAEEKTQTNVERVSDDERWAFGTAVILAPKKRGAYPEGWLFVAQKTGNGWKVGLEDTPEFAELAGAAPTTVVDEGEKKLFTAGGEYSAQAVRTGLRLPWKRSVKWKMSGGPHGWSTGYDRPYSALDLTRKRGKVRSAAGGRVYTMCSNNRGWIRVRHPNGYSTDYYHLRKNIKPRDGKWIKRGAFLGYVGTDVSCGGAAYGAHVHFSVRKNGKRVSLDRRKIGGWTFHVGRAYKGYATHKGMKRRPGSYLRNFGP